MAADGLAPRPQTINVAKARKKYGIKYPTLYATKADIDGKQCKDDADLLAYNCAQRAHQSESEFPRSSLCRHAPYLVADALSVAGCAARQTPSRTWPPCNCSAA